ncbi:MAG: hypothetical protein A2Y41_11900 [Spirochaetes bacterium GWB1_36_13]|nr:MAG: hypothetical protein A2Y41_11900 [Spirochaetes bacterium GWB1_36_13]
MTNQEMTARLKSLFSDIEIKERFHNQIESRVSAQMINGFLTIAKSEGFEHLSNLTCVDWIDQNEFHVTYNLWSYKYKIQMTVKVALPRNKAEVPTIHGIWPQAQVYEQEIHEMFGVNFIGNPNLEPLFLHNWKDLPPLRKDFDTREYSIRAYGAEVKENEGGPSCHSQN